jgi:hypothetical protein
LYEVQIENATATPLMVSEIGAFEGQPPMVTRVEPGKTLLSAWRRPRQNHPEERATVQARDEAGTVVFCHPYSDADIRAMKYHITITSGTLNC